MCPRAADLEGKESQVRVRMPSCTAGAVVTSFTCVRETHEKRTFLVGCVPHPYPPVSILAAEARCDVCTQRSSRIGIAFHVTDLASLWKLRWLKWAFLEVMISTARVLAPRCLQQGKVDGGRLHINLGRESVPFVCARGQNRRCVYRKLVLAVVLGMRLTVQVNLHRHRGGSRKAEQMKVSK